MMTPRLIRAGTLKLNGCGMIPITQIDRVIGGDD